MRQTDAVYSSMRRKNATKRSMGEAEAEFVRGDAEQPKTTVAGGATVKLVTLLQLLRDRRDGDRERFKEAMNVSRVE